MRGLPTTKQYYKEKPISIISDRKDIGSIQRDNIVYIFRYKERILYD
jgi:hypothetical protein